MFTYSIKRNGYELSQAKGVNQSVAHIERYILELPPKPDSVKWTRNGHDIRCEVTINGYVETYTIERKITA